MNLGIHLASFGFMRRARALWRRWQRRNSWWVVDYAITGEGEDRQSGNFASLKATPEEALADAKDFIARIARVSGDCAMSVRRPTVMEALFG